MNSIKCTIQNIVLNYKKRKQDELVERYRKSLLEYEYKIKLNHLERTIVEEKLVKIGYKTSTQIINEMFLLDENEG